MTNPESFSNAEQTSSLSNQIDQQADIAKGNLALLEKFGIPIPEQEDSKEKAKDKLIADLFPGIEKAITRDRDPEARLQDAMANAGQNVPKEKAVAIVTSIVETKEFGHLSQVDIDDRKKLEAGEVSIDELI